MSQAGIYFDSFSHSSKRFAETAKHGIDPLGFRKHVTHVAPIYPKKLELSNEGTAAFGSEVIYKFPTSGYVHHVVIKNYLAQTTTEKYCPITGAGMIESIKLECDGNTIMDYKYAPVFQYYLSKLNSEEARDKCLLAAGNGQDSTAAAIYTCVPIPMFFDPIMCPGISPLNLSKFKKAPELKITYRTLANSIVATSTGGSITSSKMLLYMSESTPTQKRSHNEQDYWYNSIDFYTNEGNTVATATATNIDVSGMSGQIKKQLVIARLSSDVTANTYFSNKEIGALKLDLDGHIEDIFKQKEEGEIDYIIYNQGRGYQSTLGYPYVIPNVHFVDKNYATNNLSGLHSAKINKHQINVTHALGANGDVSVLGIRSAIYKHMEGTMERFI